jgi:hypothetical protein
MMALAVGHIYHKDFKSSGVLADFLDCLTLKMMKLHSFTMSGISHVITQHHMPEVLNL